MTEPTTAVPLPAGNASWEAWRDYALEQGTPVGDLMDPETGAQRMTRNQIRDVYLHTDQPAEPVDVPAEPAPAPLEGIDFDIPVHLAWVRVMRDVLAIGKNQRTEMRGNRENYNFRGVDAVVNVVGPALRRHGMVVLPGKIVELREERYETKNGAAMHGVTVTIEYVVIGPRGDTLTLQSIGESADAGDKAVSKAQSVAYRVMFLQGLCIPTTEPDPDMENHERAGASAQGATTRNDADGHRVTRPADAPAEPRDMKRMQEGWGAIEARGKEHGLSADDIREDFRHRMGKEIDGPDTSIDDLTTYYTNMRKAPEAGTTSPDEVPQ